MPLQNAGCCCQSANQFFLDEVAVFFNVFCPTKLKMTEQYIKLIYFHDKFIKLHTLSESYQAQYSCSSDILRHNSKFFLST